MRATGMVTACAVVATLGVGTATAAAQQRGERREVRQFAPGEPGGGSIGVRVRDLTKEDTTRAKVQGGAVIADVIQGSPAEKAGVKEGDVVVEFDGERVRSARQFARLVEDTPEGRTVKAVVSRGGSRQTLEVTPAARRVDMAWAQTLGPRAREGVARGMPGLGLGLGRGLGRGPGGFEFDLPVEPGIIGAARRARLGVGVEPLGEQLAAYFGVKDGVLVASVEADSPAAKAGLKAGDVITAINGHQVVDPEALTAEVRNADAGSALAIDIVRDRQAQSLKATMPDAPKRGVRMRDRLTARRR